VIAGSYELDEVNMRSTALGSSEQYEVPGGRKLPIAETNRRPQGYGPVGDFLAAPRVQRLLNAREVAPRIGLRGVAKFYWTAC
jgi:hypothetical protein